MQNNSQPVPVPLFRKENGIGREYILKRGVKETFVHTQ